MAAGDDDRDAGEGDERPGSLGGVSRSMPTAPASSAVSTGETAMISAESPAVIWVSPSVHSSW